MTHSKLLSFFIGTLLGDSYLNCGKFYCKQISKDLIEFKAKIIENYLPGVKVWVDEHESYIDKNGVSHQKYYQLHTSRHKYFIKLEAMFYHNGKKIYPKGCIKKLDKLGFAMWYADDGTTIIVQCGRSRRVQLCTDGFTQNEHLDIKSDLESFGYNVKIIDRARKGQMRIQINKPYQDFICSISNYFYYYFPSLLYKMDLGYRSLSLNSSYVSEKYKSCYLKISAHPEFRDRIKEQLKIQDDIVESTNA